MPVHMWINPSRAKPANSEMIVDGMRFIVDLSPFETPTAVTGDYDQGSGNFVITFDYLGEEKPGSNPTVHDGITFVEGRNSGKLLRLIIPVDSPRLKKIGVIRLETQTKLFDALRTREGTAEVRNRVSKLLNHRFAEDVLQEDFGKLSTALDE